MEASSDRPKEDEEAPRRDPPSAPLSVPDTGVVFRRRLTHTLTTGRLSTDSGTSDAECSPRRCSSTDDGFSPRRISVGAESGYGSPFGAPTLAGQAYFTFAGSPPEEPVRLLDMAHLSALQLPHEGQHRRRVSSEASSFRSIGTQTLTTDFGLMCDEVGGGDDDDDDDDNISLEGSYADDAFYEDGEQEALGMGAMGGPLPDVIPETHNPNLPAGSGNGARPRNRAHSVSFPIDLNDPANAEDVGRCLKRIATDFDNTYRGPPRVNRQDEVENDDVSTLQTSASYPGENGFFAFLRSSLSSRRRQRSQSASETQSSTWAASQPEPRDRDSPEAPSTSSASSTQTPRHSSRHPDKFL